MEPDLRCLRIYLIQQARLAACPVIHVGDQIDPGVSRRTCQIKCAGHHLAAVDDPDGCDLFGQRNGCTGQPGVTIDARRPFLPNNPLKAAR